MCAVSAASIGGIPALEWQAPGQERPQGAASKQQQVYLQGVGRACAGTREGLLGQQAGRGLLAGVCLHTGSKWEVCLQGFACTQAASGRFACRGLLAHRQQVGGLLAGVDWQASRGRFACRKASRKEVCLQAGKQSEGLLAGRQVGGKEVCLQGAPESLKGHCPGPCAL
jgi:hypothetical protein